ncbi:glutamine ABC transporter ATP-binding protein [Verrucomicrobia bacterium LW23]|nr:glutamine ABC transporter ATP-binding protein [Verrucomicrobia bacterium LW23]
MNLSISNLCKTYGPHQVLRNVALEIEDGHCVALIGPSGSGKSTLLRVLAGLELPDGGDRTTASVTWDDVPMHFSDNALFEYRRGVGTVFQAYNLFPHMSALENIALPLRVVHGRTAEVARREALDQLARLGLEAHAAKRPGQLSGGQRQRVAIARAIAARPRVVFLDEPTSALDPEMKAEVLSLIAEIKSQRRDLILVTHEMHFAKMVADHMVFLADGQILQTGTPQQVMDEPTHPVIQSFFSRVLKFA